MNGEPSPSADGAPLGRRCSSRGGPNEAPNDTSGEGQGRCASPVRRPCWVMSLLGEDSTRHRSHRNRSAAPRASSTGIHVVPPNAPQAHGVVGRKDEWLIDFVLSARRALGTFHTGSRTGSMQRRSMNRPPLESGALLSLSPPLHLIHILDQCRPYEHRHQFRRNS